MLILGQRWEKEREEEMPMAGEVGREASRACKVRNKTLLQLWDDWVQGQMDLTGVTCALSCGQCP